MTPESLSVLLPPSLTAVVSPCLNTWMRFVPVKDVDNNLSVNVEPPPIELLFFLMLSGHIPLILSANDPDTTLKVSY